MTIFDVEHGSCALLTCDNGTRMMIDCGHNATTGWTPGKHLQSQLASKLDMLMVTNYDEDHVSGFRDLDSRIYIDWMVRNTSVTGLDMYVLKSESGIGTSMAHLANRVSNFISSNNPQPVFLGVTWETYNNTYPAFDDENNLSMVVSLTINGIRFLFPGDIESKGWLALLSQSASQQAAVASTDVLIASHHGRENGICEEMFDVIGCNPSVVIISDDYHKYDTQKTTQYYASKSKGISFRGRDRWVLTTRNDGDISFSFTAGQCFAY